MSPFRMQERDLDLFILEELHSGTGFAEWLASRVGLEGYEFETAEHSVSAKHDAKWGETDVLAFFRRGSERMAVLIEDKIAASFQDRQAERYHERARQIVSKGEASAYRTILIAPGSYLAGVPRDEYWQHRIPIDDIAHWFSQIDNSHARWRHNVLSSCLRRAQKNTCANNETRAQFSRDFSSFLSRNHSDFSHSANRGDNWGLTIDFKDRPKYVTLAWKLNQNLVDITFERHHKGKVDGYPEQIGLLRHSTSKSDLLRMQVGSAVWTEPISEQTDVLDEVVAACQRLRPIAIEVAALPSIVEEAPELP